MIRCKLGETFHSWFMIDSGADVNVVSESDWETILGLHERDGIRIYNYQQKPERKVRAYASQHPLTLVSAFNAWIAAELPKKPSVFAKFLTVKGGEKSLIGRGTARAMKLLQLGAEVNQLSEISELEELSQEPKQKPFPKIPGEKVAFDIDRSIPPTKNAYYHIPAAFSERASQRLKDMEAQEIIERVTKAPRWISGMSAVPKGASDFRLVVNMKGPNKAIRRCYYRLPQLVEIQRKLNGAKKFSKLDLTSAFHHVELEEDSRELTTFMAEDGMYRFTRLVFGVNCAPEMFQQIMERILRDASGVVVFIDDVLIFGGSDKELSSRTEVVVKALETNNLTLNLAKCEFDKESITFLGHQLSPEGMNIDEVKVKAIKAFREPKSPTELRSFLGLAAYVSTFIPSFGTLTHVLWKTASTKPFVWTQEAQESFELTKEAIANSTVTNGYFSDTDETILYTDASPFALGAVLTQVNSERVERVISFASKSLTVSEQRYPQTQREALGIVWAIEHYHYHLRGRHFVVRTDARGVAFIFTRERDVPKRIMSRAQGFALRLNEFSFDIEYVKGTFNIADSPSRLYKGRDEEFTEMKGPWEIGTLDGSAQELVVEEEHLTLAEMRAATLEDEALMAVISAIETGIWSTEVLGYQSVAEELYVSDGLLVKAGAAVVPKSLQTRALQIAHVGHPGATAMRSILRSRVWWSGMDRAAERYVEECISCTLVARQNPPVPMTRTALPTATWDLLAIDFNGPYARHGGVHIMLIVDLYSRYVLTAVMTTTDSKAVERVLEAIFSRYGYPKALKMDNGPPFQSEAFSRYLQGHGIEEMHSTPLYPQQNGAAERYMQLINKAVQTASLENKGFEKAVAETVRAHNMAKHRVTGVSPEELMFHRKVRRSLPLVGSPNIDHDSEGIRERDREHKKKSKLHEDGKRGAKETRLNVGDTAVIMRTLRAKGDSRFEPTLWKVVGKQRGDLDLQAQDGRTVKRNVTMVKRVHVAQDPVEPTETESNDETSSGQVSSEQQPGAQTRQPTVKATPEPRRGGRVVKPPAYLDMYIRLLNGEEFR